MIIVRLAGGLGNQIFQLGAALLLVKKYGIEKIIINDNSLNNYKTKRENELLNFFDFSKLDVEIKFKNVLIANLRIPKLFPLKLPNYPFVSDRNFQNIFYKANKYLMILDGYFQKCLTQENFNEEVKILKKIFIKNKLEKINGCIIHIRGGDFVKLGWNNITPKEYYIKAIELMKKKYHQNKFHIVTDDKNYSKTVLNELNIAYEFIGGDLNKDFYLIGSYQYRILSSSTFALWASALGNNQSSIIIAPNYWKPYDRREIFLPNEIRI